MPSGIIQPRLPGFLDLLQLKNQGRQPPLLSDFVQLTMDVADWYALDRDTTNSGSATITRNVFTSVDTTIAQVPQDEIWALSAALVNIGINATTTVLRVAIANPTILMPGDTAQSIQLGQTFAFLSTGYTFPGAVTTVRAGSALLQPRLLLPPGSYLGFKFLGEITDGAANGSVGCTYRYTRLKL